MSEDRVLEELLALRREVAEVRERLTDRETVFIGWKAIADYVGYSEDHAKELGQDAVDPIPHWHKRGFVEAPKTMLDAWLFRQRQPGTKRRKAMIVESRKRQLDMFDGAPKRGRSRGGEAS